MISIYSKLSSIVEKCKTVGFPFKPIVCLQSLDRELSEYSEYLYNGIKYNYKKEVIKNWSTYPAQNILFHISTYNEIIATLTAITKKQDKFPIIFVNSQTIKYSQVQKTVTVSIGQIIIATPSYDKNATSDIREVQTFEPILRPLATKFFDVLESTGLKAIKDERSYKEHYFWGASDKDGYSGNLFNDYVDVIEINNLKLTIYDTNNCK